MSKNKPTFRTIDQMARHLELLGYKTQAKEPEKSGEKYVVLIDHPTKSKFVLLEFSPNLIWLQANFTTNKQPVHTMGAFLSELNKDLLVSKLFYDVTGGVVVLHLRAVYTGQYEQETFGQFWDAIQGDLQQLFSRDAVAKVFVDETL